MTVFRCSTKLIWLSAVITAAALVHAEPSPSDREIRRNQIKQCRAWLHSAREYRSRGVSDSALIALDSVLVCDAGNPDGYYFKAQILAESGDTTGAVTALETGVKRAPLSSRIKTFLARFRIAAGRWQEAADLLEKVLAIKRREPEALYLNGRVLLHKGDTTAALDAFEMAAQVTVEKEGL